MMVGLDFLTLSLLTTVKRCLISLTGFVMLGEQNEWHPSRTNVLIHLCDASVQSDFDLPMIAVICNQSAGKL